MDDKTVATGKYKWKVITNKVENHRMELNGRIQPIRWALVLLLSLTVSMAVLAQWQGPTTVLDLTEGKGPNQVGVGGSEETLGEDAHNFCVDDEGNIIIADTLNKRILILTSNGSLQKVISRPATENYEFWPPTMMVNPRAKRIFAGVLQMCVYDYGGNVHKCLIEPRNLSFQFEEYAVPNGFILRQNGNEWRDIPGKPGQREKYRIDDYWAVDLEGNLLGKLPERPFELGRFVEANGKKYIVFPAATIPADAFWGYGGCHLLPDGSVFCMSSDTLYNSQGQEVGSFKVPPDVEPPTEGADFASYEGPVLDSQGNMYVIKYSLGHYTILKWTYVGTSQYPTNAPSTAPGPQRGGQTAQKAAGSPEARPRQNLKPGVTYELQLKNLQNDAGIALPPGAAIAGRFRVYGGSVVGQALYDDLCDVVRRGSVLYEALGGQGFDILDVSDPTNPQSLVGGPQALLGKARGVAIGQGVQVPEGGQDQPRTVAAFVGGGDGGREGFIEVRYADFPDDPAHPDQNPPQTAPIGQHISGAFLCHAVGSELVGPQGAPTLVKTVGTEAFVATVGVGIQQVDLNAVAHRNRYAVQANVGTYKLSETETWDIRMGIGGLGVLPPEGGSAGFVLAAVRNKGLVAYDVTTNLSGPKEAGCSRFPASVRPSGALRLNVYPSYAYTVSENGALVTKTTTLCLMAGGSAGLMIYELVHQGASVTATLKTVVPLPNLAGTNPSAPIAVYDVALDARRHIAYLACYNAGVAMVDLADPYRANAQNPYARLDEDRNERDDRILGFLHTSPGSRSTLVVDSDTGLIYVGDQGSDAGLKIVGAQEPRMAFLLDDPAHPGRYLEPGFLNAFEGDKPRLALWLPGGAGQTIHAALQLYDRKGLEETRQVTGRDAQGNDLLAPVSTVYRSVNLVRQSAQKTDTKFNFYLQDPAQPVTLGMLYDPQNPDPTLMVSKQSGTLKGTATGIQWHAVQEPWGTTPSVTRTVSRPWVEWLGYEQVPSKESQAGEPSANLVSGAESLAGKSSAKLVYGEPVFSVGKKRLFGVRVNFDRPWLGCAITSNAGNNALLGGDISVYAWPLQTQKTLKLSLEGIAPSAAERADWVSFNIGSRPIGKIDLTIVDFRKVEWVEEFTGQLDDNYDANGNPMPGGGKRIFLEKDVPSDIKPYYLVGVKATIVPPIRNVLVYFKAFDVDDPSSSSAPIDDENLDEDNRGPFKHGWGIEPRDDDGIGYAWTNADGEATIAFRIVPRGSAGNPGDNFRIAVDFFDSATMKQWKAQQNDGYLAGIVLPSAFHTRLRAQQMTDLLTVWRRLHVEWDSMSDIPITQNSTKGLITSILGGDNNLAYAMTLTNVMPPLDDGSENLNGTGMGRFQNGKIRIGTGSDRLETGVDGNGNTQVVSNTGFYIHCKLFKPGQTTPPVVGRVVEKVANVFTVYSEIPVRSEFVGGQLSVCGVLMQGTIAQVSPKSGFPGQTVLTLTSAQDIPFAMVDDDAANLLSSDADKVQWMQGQWQLLREAYDDAYVFPVRVPAAQEQDHFPPKLNLSKGVEQSQYLLQPGSGEIMAYDEGSYWCSHVMTAFQPNARLENYPYPNQPEFYRADRDPDHEKQIGGIEIPATNRGILLFYETLRDGGMLSKKILAHEIGHCFGLVDKYEEGLAGGIMATSQADFFKDVDLDWIRKASRGTQSYP